MTKCKAKEEALNVLAWEMANNKATNPEGLPKEVFMDKLRKEAFTEELKSQYTADKIEFPKYWVKNHYAKVGYESLKAEFN